MESPLPPDETSKSKTSWLRISVSYAIAGACLFWVFHGIHLRQLLGGMIHIRWWLWIVCMALQFLAYLCVAYEWQFLLRPTGRLPLKRAAQAVLAGRFANDVLPFQLGYLVRAALAARWLKVNVVSVFPSLIVERLWDGIWLAAGIGLLGLMLPLPPDVRRAGNIFGGMVLAGAAATALVVLRRSRARVTPEHMIQTNSPTSPIQRARLAFRRLTDGVRDIVRPGLLAPILGLSLLKLGIQAMAFLGFLWAYNFRLPLPAGLAVFLVGYLGICVPSTPAGTGMFQLFVVAGLTLFGISKSFAAGFALVAFISITVPLAVAGSFALAQTGLRLRGVRS